VISLNNSGITCPWIYPQYGLSLNRHTDISIDISMDIHIHGNPEIDSSAQILLPVTQFSIVLKLFCVQECSNQTCSHRI